MIELLQWSHIFSDVEIGFPVIVGGDYSIASMEPHLFRRGNIYDCRKRKQK